MTSNSACRFGIATGIAVLWLAAIIVVTRAVVDRYYPVLDEWALLVNSGRLSLGWLTEGFSQYLITHPGLSVPVNNFIRPVINLTYWLLARVPASGYGHYLYVGYVAIAACAALTYLSLTGSDNKRVSGWALGLAAAVPMLSPFIPSLRLLTLPCFAFDALAAALCLAAYLAYRNNRFVAAALLLLTAVMTKETAVPAAAGFFAHYGIRNARQFRGSPRAAVLLLVLATPVFLWIAARVAAFGSVTGGVYLWHDGTLHLRHLARVVLVWPFWFELPERARSLAAWSGTDLAFLIANAAVMSGAVMMIALRLKRRVPLDAAEVCLLFSYAFLLRVGLDARFGAVFTVFLVLALGHWLRERGLRIFAAPVLLGLALGLLVNTDRTRGYFSQYKADTIRMYDVSRRFVETLKAIEAGVDVIVLNDPSALYASIDWLVTQSGIQARVVKISEFRWPVIHFEETRPCRVSLEPLAAGQQIRFRQSCGIWMNNVPAAPTAVARLQMSDRISVTLFPELGAESPDSRAKPTWQSFVLSLDGGHAVLLYFDPSTDNFRQCVIGAGTSEYERPSLRPPACNDHDVR